MSCSGMENIKLCSTTVNFSTRVQIMGRSQMSFTLLPPKSVPEHSAPKHFVLIGGKS